MYSLNIIYFLKENCKIFTGSNIVDLTIFFLYNYINIIFMIERTWISTKISYELFF